MPGLFGAAALGLCAATASAHDFWIEPSAFETKPGERVDLVLRVGEDFRGDTRPYIESWFSDYSVAGPGGRRAVEGLTGDDPAGSFVPGTAGVFVIGYRSTRDFVELEPVKFAKYLATEGLDRIAELREQRGESGDPAPEYYSRCAKSLVRAGGGQGGHDVILGYTLELIPEADPYRLVPGDVLPVRLEYRARPIEGVLVIAFTAERPDDRIALRTDPTGRVRLPLGERGTWLVKAVHMIEVNGDPRADWESFWASLTFRLQPG